MGGQFVSLRLFIDHLVKIEIFSEKFLENLELSIDHGWFKKPYMMVVLGDFNAKSNWWYANIERHFNN